MSNLRDTLYKQYVQDTDPRYPSGREGWETYLIARIEDLECALGQALLEHKELTAENQRLRDGIRSQVTIFDVRRMVAALDSAGAPLVGRELRITTKNLRALEESLCRKIGSTLYGMKVVEYSEAEESDVCLCMTV